MFIHDDFECFDQLFDELFPHLASAVRIGFPFWRRSRIGAGWWYVDPEVAGELFDFCDSFAARREHVGSESPVNAYFELRQSLFLDGGVRMETGNYFCGRRGTWIHGVRALRFILYRLGAPQPRRFRAEREIPSHAALVAELNEQRRRSTAIR